MSIGIWCLVGLVTTFWTVVVAIAYVVHPLVDCSRRMVHHMAVLWGTSLIYLFPGTRVEIFGLDRVPRNKPVIFMANHQSYVDIPILCFVGCDFRWMADAGLFRIPVLGWSMSMAGYIPVDRGEAKQGLWAIEQAKGWLKRGVSILLFPEGTRSHTGVLGRFQTGGFRLAVSTGTPIVPIVVIGTRRILPRGSWKFSAGVKVRIYVEPLIPVSASHDLGGIRQLSRQVRSHMAAVYRKHFREDR